MALLTIRFTPQAFAEFRDVFAYLKARSPQGARHVGDRIESLLERIRNRPLIGRTTSVAGMRRVPVAPYPYIIFYTVEDDAIVVVGIRHAARDPESMPDHS
jgi:addiction module RelE/StbE family toxin